ncbi:hypothetical protein IPN35_00280 [Candidatus Peregrinibacteria bacterium]|nr:MAG: hypothetical protein IPN35_00280 [Candidatus Peregrinibacteria bacterium]
MNNEILQNQSPVEKEKKFFWKFLKHYLIVVVTVYIIFLIVGHLIDVKNDDLGLPFGTFGGISILVMYVLFGIPLLLSFIYFFKTLYYFFQKKWESFKFSLLILVLGLIIGGGICFSNIFIIGLH